jgi:hypothetical protein
VYSAVLERNLYAQKESAVALCRECFAPFHDNCKIVNNELVKEKYDFLVKKDSTSFCKVCNVIIKGTGFHQKT